VISATASARDLLASVFLVAAATIATTASCSGDASTGPRSGPPAALLIEGGQDQSGVVGSELTTALTVKVVDANGRPVRGQAVNFRIVSGGGSVFAGVAITSDSGIARERWTLGTVSGVLQQLEARAVDAAGTALVFGVFRATARPDVPATLTKVSGDTQTVVVGTAASDSLAVRVVDRFVNPVPQTWVRWSVTSGDGTLSADSTMTSALGVATVRWTVGQQAGTLQRVTATVGNLALQAFTSTATPAAAVGVAIITPAAGAASGAPFTTAPHVRLVDSFGNTAAASTLAVTLSVSSPATLLGTAVVAPTAGEITFIGVGLTGLSGDYTLTYSAPGLAAAMQSVTLAAGAPTNLVLTSQPAGAVSGAPFSTQPIVELRDNAGNRTTSAATVTATLASGAGPLQGTTAVAASAGVATFTNLRIDRATAHTLRFSVATPALSVNAEPVTVAAGSSTAMNKVGNPDLRAPENSVVPVAIQVRLVDSFGNGVPNETVNWAVTAGGGQLAAPSAVSDANGVATAPQWTLGLEAAGAQTLTASAAGLTQSFSATIAAETQSDYNLEVRWTGAPPGGPVEAAFANAVNRIRAVIVGSVAPITLTGFTTTCVPGITLNETIQGLVIYATVELIDGPGGVLGSAGPCSIRNSDQLSWLGRMRFDSADLENLYANGTLEAVILHEMLHVIGVGTLWVQQGLRSGTAPTTTPFFTGALARAACIEQHAGAGVCGGGVPVEDCVGITGCGAGTINSHWKELTFRTELMTGYISAPGIPNPFSRMTIQSLADMGYVVNINAEDPYTVPPPSLMSPIPALTIQMPEPHGPLEETDLSGRVTRRFMNKLPPLDQ